MLLLYCTQTNHTTINHKNLTTDRRRASLGYNLHSAWPYQYEGNLIGYAPVASIPPYDYEHIAALGLADTFYFLADASNIVRNRRCRRDERIVNNWDDAAAEMVFVWKSYLVKVRCSPAAEPLLNPCSVGFHVTYRVIGQLDHDLLLVALHGFVQHNLHDFAFHILLNFICFVVPASNPQYTTTKR